MLIESNSSATVSAGWLRCNKKWRMCVLIQPYHSTMLQIWQKQPKTLDLPLTLVLHLSLWGNCDLEVKSNIINKNKTFKFCTFNQKVYKPFQCMLHHLKWSLMRLYHSLMFLNCHKFPDGRDRASSANQYTSSFEKMQSYLNFTIKSGCPFITILLIHSGWKSMFNNIL